jgi:diphthamide synthase (EF-2-diphthine--ammonia ligase)
MEPRLPEKPVLVSRSGGKDGCMALREIQRTANARVAALPTTITRDYNRISMHGVRRVLLERQAASLTGANPRIAPYEYAKYSTK